MPEITFTQENLNEGNKLDPTKYKLRMKGVEEKPSSKDENNPVWHTDFIVVDGKFKDTPIKHYFNGKIMKDVVAFVACFTPGGKLEAGKNYELSALVGKEVMAFCTYDPERKQNVVQRFFPVDK